MDIKLNTPQDREQMINQLASGLSIGGTGRDNLYTISYSDRNPREAKRIVQSLLTIFVEGSLGDKRKDSDSARRFIDSQLKVYSEKLIAAESAVTEFKRKHLGLMPGEGGGYYSVLLSTKNALDQAALDLKEAQNASDAIRKQLTDEPPPTLLNEQGVPEPGNNPEIDPRVRGLEQKLDSLRLNYTDVHPDVAGTLRIIARLKEQKEVEAKAKAEAMAKAKQNKPATTATQTSPPVFQQMNLAVAEVDAKVASMKARVAEYENRYNQLKSTVNVLPQIEAEFKQVTRDYEVTKRNYETLLARREQAQISGEMESSTNVMDFRVIDPPQVPSWPSAPNRTRLMSLVFLAAMAGGIGLAFLIGQLRPTIHDERGLRAISGLPVFGSVIMAWSNAQKAKMRNWLVAFLLSVLSLLSAYGAIMSGFLLTAAKA